MRLRALPSSAFAFLTFALVTCAAHADGPRACELLNAQPAASLAGGPVAAPFDLQGIGCSYVSQAAGTTVGLTITDAEKTTPADFLHMREMTGKQEGSKTESIPGLGEHNFFVERTSQQDGLVVLFHRKMFSLGVQRKMTPALKAQMIQVMKQMLTKFWPKRS